MGSFTSYYQIYFFSFFNVQINLFFTGIDMGDEVEQDVEMLLYNNQETKDERERLLAESLQEIRQHQILLEEDLHRDVMQLRLSIEQACDQEISDLKLNSVSSKEGWNKEKLEMEEERVDSEVWSIRDKWHRVLTQRVEERMELDRVQLRKWSGREQMVLIELDNAMMDLKDEEKKEEEKKKKKKKKKNRNQDNQDR